MRTNIALSLSALVSYSSATQNCCNKLHQSLGSQVSFPNEAQYNLTESSYDATQESQIRPACIIRPNSAEDVAHAVSLLTSNHNDEKCQFAIKGGGHNAGPGFANIEDGVTFDMTSLSSIKISSDRKIAFVEAGAKWVDVYTYLDVFNVSAAGGRNGNVGVGGLLVGGGISHFSPRVGWACDNVVNFEVVLGNGSSVSANKTTNTDLFLALKGGANNFGVVTRFDLATFPQGNISSSLLISDGSQIRPILKAFTNIATSPHFDTHTSLVTTPIYNSTTKAWTILDIAVYTKPEETPPVFAEFFALPNTTRQTTVASVGSISNETQGPPTYQIYATASFKASFNLSMELFNIMDTFFQSYTPPSGSVEWVLGFEPLVAGLINSSSGYGSNVLGLDKADRGFVLLVSPTWSDDAASGSVQQATRHVLSLLEAHAESRGMLERFQYLNYASPYQKPLASYGTENLNFLREVSKRYDPGHVFQHQVPGGFKLW